MFLYGCLTIYTCWTPIQVEALFWWQKSHNGVNYVNWFTPAGRARLSSVTDPTSLQGLLFLITELRRLIQLKWEEVVKRGLLKVHAKFAENQIVFINIYTSMVGKGQLCFFKNTGYSFSVGHSAFWLGKVGFIVRSVPIQMGTIWRLILLCQKACPVSHMSLMNGKISDSSWKCSLNPSASQGVFGKR